MLTRDKNCGCWQFWHFVTYLHLGFRFQVFKFLVFPEVGTLMNALLVIKLQYLLYVLSLVKSMIYVVCTCRVNHAVSWKLMKPHMQVKYLWLINWLEVIHTGDVIDIINLLPLVHVLEMAYYLLSRTLNSVQSRTYCYLWWCFQLLAPMSSICPQPLLWKSHFYI